MLQYVYDEAFIEGDDCDNSDGYGDDGDDNDGYNIYDEGDDHDLSWLLAWLWQFPHFT